MIVSNLPEPKLLDTVSPGSLVMVPGENLWGIRMFEDNLYMLESQRPQNWNGKLAYFGQGFDVFINAESGSRLTYPWGINSLEIGALALFNENDSVSRSVVLGNSPNESLITFDLDSGQRVNRRANSGEAIAYSIWGINLRCSDKLDDFGCVYSFGGTDQSRLEPTDAASTSE